MKTYLAATLRSAEYEVQKKEEGVTVKTYGETWAPTHYDTVTCTVKSLDDNYVIIFKNSETTVDASELYELHLALLVHFKNEATITLYRKEKK